MMGEALLLPMPYLSDGNAAVRFYHRMVAVSLLFIAVKPLASEYTQNWQASKLQPAPLCRTMSLIIGDVPPTDG